MKVKTVPRILVCLVIFIAIANGLAFKYFLYWRIRWLDMPMHFLSGFWLGLCALWLYFLSKRFVNVVRVEHRTRIRVVFLSVLAALAFGLLWEGYEFGINIFIRNVTVYDMQDTLSDLFFDFFGSLVAAGIFIGSNLYLEEKHII